METADKQLIPLQTISALPFTRIVPIVSDSAVVCTTASLWQQRFLHLFRQTLKTFGVPTLAKTHRCTTCSSAKLQVQKLKSIDAKRKKIV